MKFDKVHLLLGVNCLALLPWNLSEFKIISRDFLMTFTKMHLYQAPLKAIGHMSLTTVKQCMPGYLIQNNRLNIVTKKISKLLNQYTFSTTLKRQIKVTVWNQFFNIRVGILCDFFNEILNFKLKITQMKIQDLYCSDLWSHKTEIMNCMRLQHVC